MPHVQANGVRLYYEEHGAGAPIVCVHGTSTSAMVWRPAAIQDLAGRGRTIVYDRRGCTRSERPDPYETSLEEHAEDAAALLEALDATPAIVIGRSYGGQTAIELALRHPEAVRALVLLDAAALPLDDEAMAWAGKLRLAVEEAAKRDIDTVAEVFLRPILGDEAWESFPEPLKAMVTENAPAILAELRGPWLDADADLARIAAPTLLVAGKESPPAFRRITERMAAAIPEARVVLAEGGHLIDPGHPDVLGFVDRVLGTAAQS